jgi:glycosyltransferase involved in cell wall biosynthesis
MPVVMASEPFSVLLPVYAGDEPAFLERAFDSATVEQGLPPGEVVVVRDGPVPEPMEQRLAAIVARSPVPVTLIELPENRGLGDALGAGLEACRYDIVARVDADDVCLPTRFQIQVPLIGEGFDVVGSSLAEMGQDEQDILGIRRPPLHHADIARFARFHSPFNHPTVVFRRSAVMRAGGYQHRPYLEDYWLWVRLLSSGARARNVEEPLLKYRVGAGAYERRGGWRVARSEFALQVAMRRIGFTSRSQFARNVIVRCGWRLVPVGLRRALYGQVFRDDDGMEMDSGKAFPAR